MIVFLSDCFHHHQWGVADELYALTQGEFRFIETIQLPDSRKRQGFLSVHRDYLVCAWKGERELLYAKELILNSEVLVFGGNSSVLKMAKARVDSGKFSFLYSERWLKKGLINLLSPNLMKEFLYYHLGKWGRKPVYRLCASAYTANDSYLLGEFKNKCYKWAYFTPVNDSSARIVKSIDPGPHQRVAFMWCARFIDWKHPELPVLLAQRLKQKGYDIVIDMFGDGEMLNSIKALIEEKGLHNEVRLYGNCPNTTILNEMRRHVFFLFTSDQNEGWGAVLNEAMTNGCVPIASDKIGSVPFLLNDGINGKVFRSNSIDSLEDAVVELINSPIKVEKMSQDAQETMQLWSPKVAAQRLLKLVEALYNGQETPYESGPCSRAYPV